MRQSRVPLTGLLAVLLAVTTVAAELQRRPGPRPRESRQDRRIGALRPGDPAPDFTLPALKGDRHVRLSSFQGHKPVALVFGSYT